MRDILVYLDGTSCGESVMGTAAEIAADSSDVTLLSEAVAAAMPGRGLVEGDPELAAFRDRYRRPSFTPARPATGDVVRAFVGVDGGSTSTKGVLLAEDETVLFKHYQLSKGNPIQDTIDVFEGLRAQVEGAGARLEVLGVGTTGYAKDILKDVLHADAALVEGGGGKVRSAGVERRRAVEQGVGHGFGAVV